MCINHRFPEILLSLTNNVKRNLYITPAAPGLLKMPPDCFVEHPCFHIPKRQETSGTLTSVAGSLNTGAESEATSATTRT